jgi:hypothetical protein
MASPDVPAPAAALYPLPAPPREALRRARWRNTRARGCGPGPGRKGCGRRHRVVGLDRRAAVQQLVYDHPTRRFGHVVGVRLEGQAPEGEGASLQIVAEAGSDLVCRPAPASEYRSPPQPRSARAGRCPHRRRCGSAPSHPWENTTPRSRYRRRESAYRSVDRRHRCRVAQAKRRLTPTRTRQITL